TTLTGQNGVFAALNAGVINSNTVVTITSDISEPGTNSLNQVNEEGPNGGALTITIQSEGNRHVISGAEIGNRYPLISINGAKRLTINGGVGKLLTFRNTNSSPANTGPVFQFDNSSQDDLLTNCIIESNLTSNNYGAVRIHSSGINNVTINQNDIRDARAGTIGSPIIGIYSSSTNNTVNIKNNNIYNLINPNSYGIYLNQVANGCSVTGNSIYMENGKAASGSFTGIMIGSAGNHIVSGNYIGGSAPNCGGSVPLTVSGPGKFTGISSYYTSTPEVIIQGNTIQNISMTNTGAAVFYGINNNSGPIIITGNTIGSPATTNSIQLAGTGSSAGIIQSLSAVINPCTIEKNIVANINLTNGSGNQTFSALLTTGGTVRMNTIYNIGSTVASSNPVIYGINNTDGITSNEFSNNVISLNSGAATTPTLYGFYEFSGKGTTGFYYNSINLYGAASGSTNSYTFNRTGRGTYISNNNVLINARTGGTGIHYAIYSIPDSGFTSDYNDLFVSGTTLGHWGSVGSTNNKTDLEAWRGSSNQDANSISVNPLFTSTTNLVPPIDSPIIGVGTPLQSVTTDLSGVLRNLSAPTLGAYELACTGPTTGGIIAGDQTIGDSSLPSLITSSSSASGYSGRLEYKWQKAISPFTTWDDISTSNASTYQPESLTQTTQFKRLARNTCMAAGWAGAAESNRVTITININSWRGTSSKDWNDPGNWAQNRVPGIDENIAFDETSLNDCQLNNDLSVNNITNNQSSYRLNTNGKTLTIKGKLDITKAPLIEASTPNSTILFSGSASQTIPLGAFVNDRVYNLSINNPHNVILNGSLNLLNSITATSGQLDASTNAPAIIYSGTNMQSINSSTFIKNKVYDLIVDNSSGVSLASDLSIDHTLTVNSGKQLIIPAGTLLNVDGIIKNADASGLVIQASPTGDAPNGSLIFHNASSPESFVPATVEMYTKANRIAGSYKWQFFGIPLKSIQANPTFAGSYVREMHEDVTGTTGHWVQLQNESVLTSFTGYEITQETSKIIRFKGNLENADYGPVKLSYTSEATYAGQHLIGNPYLAAITIKNTVTPSNALIFGDGMDKTVYLYNTGSYADWSSNEFSNGDNSAPGQYLAIPQNNAGSSLLPASIPSMQAFLVMVNAPGETATISIPYSSTGTVVKNTTQQRAPTSDLISTRIDVKGSMFGDSMWIFTVPTCTRGYDNGWDGYKIMGSSLAPQLYAMESDGDYQVNSVDDINNTYLGFRAGIDTIYTLTFTHQNRDTRYQHLYLTDLSANITVEITATGTQYRFNSNLGTSLEKRFKLIATADAIDIPTENKSADARVHSLTVFSSQNIIFVNNRSNLKGSLYIYDITGRMIQKMQFEAHVITTLPVHLPGGSYLSRAVTMSEEATTKLAIQAH
ncbi:MAG: hypothetical protein Q8904_15580, partial [Bacteroidota bacterium]|nr:hypothetical protein [Bacteroidota bacterium]